MAQGVKKNSTNVLFFSIENRSHVLAIYNAETDEVGQEVRSEYMELRKTLRAIFVSEAKQSSHKVYGDCKSIVSEAN